MHVRQLAVQGMSCTHCQQAVDEAVRAVAGVEDVKVNLDEGTVEVTFQNEPGAAWEQVKSAIQDAGYQVVSVPSPS